MTLPTNFTNDTASADTHPDAHNDVNAEVNDHETRLDALEAVPAFSSGLHSARPAFGTAGRQYFETDTHVLYLDTGTAWIAMSTGWVAKTADETLNAQADISQSYALDAELKWPIEVAEKWAFDMVLRLTGASTNADWKFGWAVPASGTVVWAVQGAVTDFASGSNAAVPVGTTPGSSLAAGSTLSVGGRSSDQQVRLAGIVTSPSNAGTIQLKRVQDTSTAENSVIKATSICRLTRIV